ncbi:TIGR02680 family protein [Microbispora sp. RL4-1S]|uniref:TIGR02680 family protein n=1 Tax=Microbispora oryzae TaxID=2806554 RepID=A0A940WMT9_9ACTN|nr:SbcC/MukB-like Walker B domain-containing protein [Microbispora oryzae]MBP2703941.1 TIGR02680 family protein [Microbispora oryzae]
MTRFKPSRAGLINIWDYTDEEFAFADGRLVLRGHNGSGKTKALEVLFPFILDGVVDARRLDPFSGENRTMKSNLLYRGQESEYGFVWMEFANGGKTVTLIIAMHARRDRPDVKRTYFVTARRVGVDFGLLSEDARPVTDQQLRRLLEPGAARTNPTDYRDAVDAALFRLGRERYTQLLDLLLALRRPLLAKDLDPAKVSDTLTAGLSPVSDDLIEQAARDFDNLEAVQRLADDLATADAAARAFLTRYADYLQVGVRDQLTRIEARVGQAVHPAVQVRRAQAEMRRAEAAQEAAEAERDAAAADQTRLEGRLEALRRHEAYAAQGELEDLRAQVARGAQEIARAREANGRAARHIADLRGEAAEAGRELDEAREAAARQSTAGAEAAELAGVPAPEGTDPMEVRARAVARLQDAEDVRSALRRAGDAEAERDRAGQSLERAHQKIETSEQACRRAQEALGDALARAEGELRAWAGRWAGDGPEAAAGAGDADVLTRGLSRLPEAGAPSLGEVFAELAEARRTALAAESASAEAAVTGLTAEIARLTAERDEVASERDDAPPLDAARQAGRDARPGAPLWRLVRFAEEIPRERAASVEAALDAAGLLTAWVHPDPRLTAEALAEPLSEPRSESYLLAAPPERRPSGRTLASVLVPEEQDDVPADVVAGVLASIALTDDLDVASGVPAISTRGQFGYGVHVGARTKAAPEYIGATNRAARRRARLAEFDEEIRDRSRERDRAEAEREAVRRRLDDLGRARAELRQVGRDVPKAATALTGASALLAAARAELAEASTALDAATAEMDAERRRLRQTAADRNMPVTAAEVDAVVRAVGDFTAAAERQSRHVADAERLARDLAARHRTIERLETDLGTAAGDLADKEEAHLRLAERLSVLEDALGAPLKEVLGQINEAERALAAATARWRAADQKARAEHDALVEATTACRHGRDALAAALRETQEQLASFAPYTQAELRPVLGLPAEPVWPGRDRWAEPEKAAAQVVERLAVPPPAGSPAADPAAAHTDAGGTVIGDTVASGTVAGDAALAVRSVLPEGVAELLALCERATEGRQAGDGARKRSRDRMSDALKEFGEALNACEEDYRLDWEQGESLVLVRIHDADGRHPVTSFARRVGERAREQAVLLEERERVVLEDELLTGLADQISDRVRLAKDLVRGMDADTRSRPMSTGTTVGIRWVVADGAGDAQRQVSELLGRDDLGPGRLAELRGLLRQMIREYRAAHPRATYKEALSTVLDYRAWRAFELRLKVPGEEEVKLSRKRHSQMSGGEKSAAIHLPLFAAANALYGSAAPDCPRLIALDEAFAGIDDVYKPDLLGLTVRYDLDVFMTGHDLWVRYDTVPAVAHYDMHSDKATHTVSSMLVLWDGCELVDSAAGFSGNDDLARELLGFTPTRRGPAEEGVLVALGDNIGTGGG